MIKRVPLICLMALIFLAGCHAAQEKAWDSAMETTRQKITADEKLSANINRIELERRQFVRVYINNQKVRSNFSKLTAQVAQIVGDALFADPGNKFKDLTVFGNLVDGDEIIVCKYKDGVVTVEKDRTMHSM